MTDVERARRAFQGTVYATELTGCVIDEVGDGWAVCLLELQDKHMNSLGIPMGGAVFTLADYAFGVASNFDRDVFVSTSADVHFLTPAKGRILRAEAREVRSGRRTCLFSVTVTDEKGTNVAYLTVAGMWVAARNRNK